jgi:hypothetical protein
VSTGATDAESVLISNFLTAPLLAEENPPPQPKLRERSLPVPRGMMLTGGTLPLGDDICSSSRHESTHPTVPSPPATCTLHKLRNQTFNNSPLQETYTLCSQHMKHFYFFQNDNAKDRQNDGSSDCRKGQE